MASDPIQWRAEARAIQYGPESVAEIALILGHEPTGPELRALEADGTIWPDDITYAEGNLVTTAGLNRITALIIGVASTQAFGNSRAVVGVGNGSTAAAVADADLSAAAGAANRWFQGADASNPTQSGGVITCNSTFGVNDGNFAWAEWCWAIATAAPVASAVFATATSTGIMLNHRVQSLGAKAAGSIWTHQATVTLA